MLETSEMLLEAVGEAVETMAFMCAMPAEEELPRPGSGVKVTMRFTGRVNGQAELAAGKDFVELLAANVMGVDSGDPEAQAKGTDAFKELLNTTCGLLLPKLAATPADVFDVTIPEATAIDSPEQWDALTSEEGMARWSVDGFALAARLTIEEE